MGSLADKAPYQDIADGIVDILITGESMTSPSMSPTREFVIFAAPERGNGENGVVTPSSFAFQAANSSHKCN